MTTIQRKYSVGAEVIHGGVHFRVWAPALHKLQVVIKSGCPTQKGLEKWDLHKKSGLHKNGDLDKQADLKQEDLKNSKQWDLHKEPNGYWSAFVPDAKVGDHYFFRLDGSDILYPDPASRFQPEGPHGPSAIVDATIFQWNDKDWQGIQKTNRVIYEMHIGTFTQEGTYRAAAEELAELARLGITIVELMPLAEFDGAFGWGYDGVDLYAPYHHYGTPDELRSFINEAHHLGIGVILDVVYNHCGASGCYLHQYSPDYFSSIYKSEWGDGFNFDGPNSDAVRSFICDNAGYWIDEFHFDGFRLDATQQIFDTSPRHIIKELVAAAHSRADGRQLYIIAENEPQHSVLVRPSEGGGYGLDGIVNDDFHHAAMVALKGQREAYFHDYLGRPQEFVSTAKYGFLYQGQWCAWQNQRRGSPTFSAPPATFIHFLQNHDQVANTGDGTRVDAMSHPGLYRAFTALCLLGPGTPMLFQGQEFFASAPFCYFADHRAELADAVAKGRREFLHQFPSLAAPESQECLRRPDDPATFNRCKLDFNERELHAEAYRLHRDLLALRRDDPIFSHAQLVTIDGAVLSGEVFMLRYFSQSGIDDRLLLLNMGSDLPLVPMPEPLLAPHDGFEWQILWSSEHPTYGGRGTVPWRMNDKCILPGRAAVILRPRPRTTETDTPDISVLAQP